MSELSNDNFGLVCACLYGVKYCKKSNLCLYCRFDNARLLRRIQTNSQRVVGYPLWLSLRRSSVIHPTFWVPVDLLVFITSQFAKNRKIWNWTMGRHRMLNFQLISLRNNRSKMSIMITVRKMIMMIIVRKSEDCYLASYSMSSRRQ